MARAKHAQIAQLSFGLLILDPEAHRIHAMKRTRKCLCCGDQFSSHGPGNRICSPCKALDAWTSPNEFSIATTASF